MHARFPVHVLDRLAIDEAFLLPACLVASIGQTYSFTTSVAPARERPPMTLLAR